MQTNVALDAHGNPLPEEEEDPIDGDVALENGDYGERERLTSNVDDDADDAHDEAPSCEQLAAPLPCGKQCPTEQCPAEFDCNVFDQFVSIPPLSLLVVFCYALLRHSRTSLTSRL